LLGIVDGLVDSNGEGMIDGLELGDCDREGIALGVFEGSALGNKDIEGTALGRYVDVGRVVLVGAPDGAVDKLGSCERVGYAEAMGVGTDVALLVGDSDDAGDGCIDGGIEGGCVGEGTRGPLSLMKSAATSLSSDDHRTSSSSSASPLKFRIFKFCRTLSLATKIDWFASSLVSFIVTSTISSPY